MSDQPFWASDEYTGGRPIRVEGGIRIHAAKGAVARTWWSARFLSVLERLGVGGRLSRGKTYARSGQIVSLDVDAGAAVALVQGTRPQPYRVRIGLRVWDKPQWRRVEEALAADAWYAAALLSGTVPPEIEELLDGLGLSLFPAAGGDLAQDCSCPDATVPCKHLAAVFYVLAERCDTDPFTLLTLRGRDRTTLLERLREERDRAAGAGAPSGPAALADLLDGFWTAPAGGAAPPSPPETEPDAVLDQVPEPALRAGPDTLTDLLRPVYRALAHPDR
ncbi:SWIM zinc finger family protein [Pseudonocardia parietis]|uniref:Zn finger protein n=1 Tax=Pseudonocardia parietis TaxID=570936 RepID=A0ABS4VZ82_9PSEU|nr:SWIM zinc finger family protein [Pseudonocardia parietis]MBP2368784.1 putative Zn finger protein [Pseudonocardia parietis]